METINNTQPSTKIVQERDDLDLICRELDLKDIKYLPSPKQKEGNIADLTRHATRMLKTYKRLLNGDEKAPIKEIFNS